MESRWAMDDVWAGALGVCERRSLSVWVRSRVEFFSASSEGSVGWFGGGAGEVALDVGALLFEVGEVCLGELGGIGVAGAMVQEDFSFRGQGDRGAIFRLQFLVAEGMRAGRQKRQHRERGEVSRTKHSWLDAGWGFGSGGNAKNSNSSRRASEGLRDDYAGLDCAS